MEAAAARCLHVGHSHHEYSDEPRGTPYVHILGALCMLVLTDIVAGFLPYFIRKKSTSGFKLMNCFAGGALFALALLDIMPHYAEFLESHAYYLVNGYNIVYLLHFLGAMGALVLESVISVGCHCHSSIGKEGDVEAKGSSRKADKGSDETQSTVASPVASPVSEYGGMAGKGDSADFKSIILKYKALTAEECASRGFGFILSASAWSSVSLGLHILFEGLMLGTLSGTPEVWAYAACVLMHKWTESCSIVVALLRSNAHPRVITAVRILVPLWTVVGCAIGMLARSTTFATGVLVGSVGNGIVIYTAFETLLDSAKVGGPWRDRLVRAVCAVGGGLLIMGVVIVEHVFSAQ